METKAQHTIVGSFVLVLITALFLFVMWISGVDFKKDNHIYLINFTGSVTGLRVGESVRFHGIPIGAIKKIAPLEEDPQIIQVQVNIDNTSLIREDSVAAIEPQGLTGFTYVQIDGGSRLSPLLQVQPGKDYPIIASRPSRIEEFFKSAPKIMSNLSDLSARINHIFSDASLTDLTTITHNIAQISDDFKNGPASLSAFVKDMKKTLYTFNKTVESVQTRIDPLSDEVLITLQNLRVTSQKLQQSVDVMHSLLVDTRPQLKEFIATGLPDITGLVNETQQTIERINHILLEFERGPAQLLSKTSQQGYTPHE